MTTNNKLALAWTIVPLPVVLFMPVFALGSRGRLASSYPWVIVVSNALFAVMEGIAFWHFAKSRPVSVGSSVGCVLSFGVGVASIFVGGMLLASRM